MKQCILVVSFGTSYHETREKTIGQIERTIAERFPGREVRRAFTSGMIIRKLEKEGIHIDNVDTALEKLAREGFEEVIVQPTHMMNGEEYDRVRGSVERYAGRFGRLRFGSPVLTTSADYSRLVRAVMSAIPEASDPDTAVVFMGHGTKHYADSAYAALDYRFKTEGYPNVFVGTVEGYPDIGTLVEKLRVCHPKKVALYPLMVVAGDHAVHDMAGEGADSWKHIFREEGYQVDCVVKGLGEVEAFRDIFVDHIKTAGTFPA